jgi:hypothetical protein
MRLGVFPTRKLITRPPGSAGPLPALIGFALVVAAVVVFATSFDRSRTAFDFTPGEFSERWNTFASATGRELLALSEPILDAAGEDPTFEHAWSDTLVLTGRVDASSGLMVEVVVVGSPGADGGELIASAMDLLVATTEPGLDAEARAGTLQDLGLIGGGGTPEAATTVGTTDYQMGVSQTGTVGLAAAPHSTLADGFRS